MATKAQRRGTRWRLEITRKEKKTEKAPESNPSFSSGLPSHGGSAKSFQRTDTQTHLKSTSITLYHKQMSDGKMAGRHLARCL